MSSRKSSTKSNTSTSSNTNNAVPTEQLATPTPTSTVQADATKSSRKSKKVGANDVVVVAQELTNVAVVETKPVEMATTASATATTTDEAAAKKSKRPTKSTKSTKSNDVEQLETAVQTVQTTQSEPVVAAAADDIAVVATVATKQTASKSKSKKAEQVQTAKPVDEPKTPVMIQVAQEGGEMQMGNVEGVEGADGEMDKNADSDKTRYFKLIYGGREAQGRYGGRKPKQAANKAFSSVQKDMKKKGIQEEQIGNKINFAIRECTRGSDNKTYTYVGVRQALGNPVKVEIKNNDGTTKDIIYKFQNKIKKAPKVVEDAAAPAPAPAAV